MTTLYVSDLDGTLLQPDARLSDTTVEILNREIAAGKLRSEEHTSELQSPK